MVNSESSIRVTTLTSRSHGSETGIRVGRCIWNIGRNGAVIAKRDSEQFVCYSSIVEIVVKSEQLEAIGIVAKFLSRIGLVEMGRTLNKAW